VWKSSRKTKFCNQEEKDSLEDPAIHAHEDDRLAEEARENETP
jgi:hypothetical protein